MPQYYYAVAGLLVLVVLLLIMRAQKAKAAKVEAPLDIHAGWLPDSVANATPDAWASPVDESKRKTRARTRAAAKAAAKDAAAAKTQAKADAKAEAKAAKAGVPVPAGSDNGGQPPTAKRHRRSKNAPAPVATADAAAAAAAADEAPALINQDGWLTTAPDESSVAAVSAQPVPEVRDLFQPPAPAYAVPQQHAPSGESPSDPARVFAMAGASTTQAEAAGAAAPAAAATTSFTELMSAPPAPSAPPVAAAPELPLGPYTYGARTILPGK